MLGTQGNNSGNENSSQILPEILNFLRLSQVDTREASPLSQAFEERQFQLGDTLYNYNQPHLTDKNLGLYLICQGRVRLLGFEEARGKEVSAMVLEAGESFGTEALFADIPSLRQAIAASDTQVAWIPLTQLQPRLEKLPNLQEYLQQTALTRQRLIFFKTSTDWRRLPTVQLQEVLPYLREAKIPAGEKLIESSPSGRFWLRSGEINQGESVNTPGIGESWGYPSTPPNDWIAQTDLLVYQLPQEDWQVVENAGISLDSTSDNNHRPLQGRTTAPLLRSQQPAGEPQTPPPPNSPTASVVFPKPSGQGYRKRSFWQRYPFIQQQSAADCGAACLAMVSRYWGKTFSLNYLRNLANVGRAGASLKSLANGAESLGFQARPVRASLSRLVEQKKPWIAHWQGDHYVVVYRVKGDRLLMADPGVGKRLVSRQEFLANWTGYALLLDPTERLEAVPNKKNSLRSFLRVIWPYRSLVLQIIFASLLIQVFGLITPLFTQIILDRVVVNKSFATLHVFAIGLVLFGVWRIGLMAIRQYLLDYFANRLDLTLISGFINHALKLPLSFFELRHVGDIITRVQENQKIQRFLTRQAITTWLDSLMAIVYIGLMAYYNWRLTLLVVGLIPPIAILTVVASPFLRGISRQIFNKEAEQNSSLVEMMTGVATVKAAAAEPDLRWRWEDRLTATLNSRFRGQKLANGLQSTGRLINTLGTTALLWYGAMLVIEDQLTIGQFVAFNMLIGNVINPVLSLVSLWDQLQEVMVSVERLNDVLSQTPEESPDAPLMVLPQLRGDVKFENVTFRYDQEAERNILENLNFEVNSGQTIAIVGRSGSGKSTLVKLLQSLYYATNGRILVDGHDIRHVSPSSLRSQLGVVPQECFLFSGTILENITLYSDEFNLEKVTEVAKLAEAHAFIQDLPLGYNTKVGERGANLSGGQRQRIAIARALLGEPRILVLDEATSSLDTESERRFQQNLTRISRDRTTFIIAHRLSTVRNADCILVLDKGLLVERGNHEQLMALQGIYYHLAQQQLDL